MQARIVRTFRPSFLAGGSLVTELICHCGSKLFLEHNEVNRNGPARCHKCNIYHGVPKKAQTVTDRGETAEMSIYSA